MHRWRRPTVLVLSGCAIALASLAGTAAHAAQAVYALDPEHSWVHFEVRHFGTSTTRGRFGPFRGEIRLDREAGTGAVELRIATATVDTGLPFFDARLRQADLLASEAHPQAVFAADSFRFDGERLNEVAGELTLRGVTRPLVLKSLRFDCRADARRQTEVCGGDFETRIHRSSFGIWYGWPIIGNAVRLQVQVEGLRRSPAAD